MLSLEHLVDHYTRFSDGLPTELRNPVSTKAQLPPKVPSPSQALIAKHRTKHEDKTNPSSSSSSNSSISVLRSSTEPLSPLPPRDMPKPKDSPTDANTTFGDSYFRDNHNRNDDSPSPELPPRVPPSRDPRCNTNYPTNLKPIDRRKKYENNETLRRIRHSR